MFMLKKQQLACSILGMIVSMVPILSAEGKTYDESAVKNRVQIIDKLVQKKETSNVPELRHEVILPVYQSSMTGTKLSSLYGTFIYGPSAEYTINSQGNSTFSMNANTNYSTSRNDASLVMVVQGKMTVLSQGDNILTFQDRTPLAEGDGVSSLRTYDALYTDGGTVSLTGNSNKIIHGAAGVDDSHVIARESRAIAVNNGGSILLEAKSGDNEVSSYRRASYSPAAIVSYINRGVNQGSIRSLDAVVTMRAPEGTNYVTYQSDSMLDKSRAFGLYSYSYWPETQDADYLALSKPNGTSQIVLEGKSNVIRGEGKGGTEYLHSVDASAWGSILLHASENNNTITVGTVGPKASAQGIYTKYHGKVTLQADKGSNEVAILPYTVSAGGAYAVESHSGTIEMQAPEGNNKITILPHQKEAKAAYDGIGKDLPDKAKYSGIYSHGEQAKIALSGENNLIIADVDALDMGDNAIGNGISAVDLGNVTLNAKDSNVIQATTQAVYSQNGTILIKGSENQIHGEQNALYAVSTDPQKGSQISVSGQALITRGGDNPVIVSDGRDFTEYPTTIHVEYDGHSALQGTIRALGLGEVSVLPMKQQGHLIFDGNIDAHHGTDENETRGGTVNLSLSANSVWTGWSDTGLVEGVKEKLPFTQEIPSWGHVGLQMTSGSQWNITKQSSVSTVSGNGGTLYFKGNGGSALHVGTLTGSHIFSMNLSMDGTHSDMVYIHQGTDQEQTLEVRNLKELDRSMKIGDAVRFATVTYSQNEFRDGKILSSGADGIYNGKIFVQYRDMATDPLNQQGYDEAYHGTGDNLDQKLGAAAIHDLYDGDEAKNVYLVKMGSINDGAKALGKVDEMQYRYLTDLDTFTKRTGQTQYFTPDKDEGGWVRYHHKRMGLDGVGYLNGNAYEIGYTNLHRDRIDRKDRLSVSLAYSHPYGTWADLYGHFRMTDWYLGLYDSHYYYADEEHQAKMEAWKKDDHAYWDNYLKLHRINQKYSVIDHETGTSYDGDYRQYAFNLSTEYGRKHSFNEDWYGVPQAQLQLSYLRGFRYKDSQQLRGQKEHAWSLLGRIGFDLTRQWHDEIDSKLYFKLGLLHEFLDGSHSSIGSRSEDGFTDGIFTVDDHHKRTWGILGVGYSRSLGKNLYGYIDWERYIGGDYSKTYELYAGINWKF